MQGLVIEKMRETDLPDVLAIENLSFPTPFTENLFRMELNLNVAHLFVARKEGRLIGYLDFWRVGPEVHLITIAVHPEFRKYKIGSILLDFMLADCRRHHVEHVSLDVRPSNDAAIRLYEKYGFRQTGLRKAYYQDNQEDALVLGLSFTPPDSEQLTPTTADKSGNAGH